jgi:hypothetical protein
MPAWQASRFRLLAASPKLETAIGSASTWLGGQGYLTIAMTTHVVLVFLVFADQILGLWLGGDFAVESAGVLRFLSIAVLLNSVGYIPLRSWKVWAAPM